MNSQKANQGKTDGATLNRREMIQGMVGLLAVGAVSASGQPTKEPPASKSTTNSDARTMAERAEICQSQVMEVARGPGGLIISHPKFDTRLPLQEGDIPPSLHRVLDAVWGPRLPQTNRCRVVLRGKHALGHGLDAPGTDGALSCDPG